MLSQVRPGLRHVAEHVVFQADSSTNDSSGLWVPPAATFNAWV